MTKSRYFIKEADVTPYSPANHGDTVNRRLIGPETVGAKHLEVLLGVVGGKLGPGDSCFFPANEVHAFTRISEEPVRVLVIYSPPYGESKEKGIAA